MGNRFNTDDMLEVYLFENQQLLEKLDDIAKKIYAILNDM